MALIDPVPPEQLGTRYTHRGWFLLCPVYGGELESDAPLVAERNGIPTWWFNVNLALVLAFNWLGEAVFPDWESAFPFVFTGRLGRPADR